MTIGMNLSRISKVRRKISVTPMNLLITGHSFSGKSSFIRTFLKTLDILKVHPEMFDGINGLLSDTTSRSGSSEVEPSDTSKPMLPPMDAELSKPETSLPLEIDMDGEKVLLRITDSKGLDLQGDINNANVWFRGILQYIESQYLYALSEESKIQRDPRKPDLLTHATIFLLNPANILRYKGLSKVDIKVMNILGRRTNLVLSVGKADHLSKTEMSNVREWVRRDVHQFQLPVVTFETASEAEEGQQDISPVEFSLDKVPFVLMASEMDSVDIETKDLLHVGVQDAVANVKVLAREYAFGRVDVENPNFSDYLRFKDCILAYRQELRLSAREIFYENWRTERLSAATGTPDKSMRLSSESMAANPNSISPQGATMNDVRNNRPCLVSTPDSQNYVDYTAQMTASPVEDTNNASFKRRSLVEKLKSLAG